MKFSTFSTFHIQNHLNTLLGIRTKRRQQEPLNSCRSLDELLPGQDGEEITLMDAIEDTEAQEPFADVEQADVYRLVREAVEDLPEQNKDIIKAFFFEGETLKEISERSGVSAERIRQHKTKSLNMLRRHKELKAFYNDFYHSSGFGSFRRLGASSVELTAERREERLKEMEEIRAYLISAGYTPEEALRITTP